MTDQWEEVGVEQVAAGDVVRYREAEFAVARVDPKFLGMDTMVCLIEDTPERWHAYPAPIGAVVERRVAS